MVEFDKLKPFFRTEHFMCSRGLIDRPFPRHFLGMWWFIVNYLLFDMASLPGFIVSYLLFDVESLPMWCPNMTPRRNVLPEFRRTNFALAAKLFETWVDAMCAHR